MSFRTQRMKVLRAGISIGSEEITAGTLTGRFIDLTDNTVVMVSNRHVFEGTEGKTKVVQPGVYDGGAVPGDVVGTVKRLAEWGRREELPFWKRVICFLFGWVLEEWCHRKTMPENLDAGVATWDPIDLNRQLGSGVYMDDQSVMLISKTHPGDSIVGKKVWKAGRTTGVNDGEVVDDKATVRVWYGDRWRTFTDVVVVRGIARGGDSGSPVFLMEGDTPSENDSICGILFAGSSEYWIFCKYKYLESELKVRWLA